MFCQKCGNRLEEGDAFCGNCGKMVGTVRKDEEASVSGPDVRKEDIGEKAEKPQKSSPGNRAGTLIYAAVCLLIGLLALILTLVYVHLNSPEKRIEYRLTEGFEYLKSHDCNKAAKAFEEAIAIDPRDPVAYQALTDAYIGIDKPGRLKDLKEDASEELAETDYEHLKTYITDALETLILEEKRKEDPERVLEYVDILRAIDNKKADELSSGMSSQ